MNESMPAGGLFLLMFLAAAGGFIVGAALAINEMRSSAIKAGVGRWTINAETGVQKFELGHPSP